MQACLSSVTTLPATFADDVAACADAGCQHLEVWLTKLETYLQGNGAWASSAAVKNLLQERSVTLVGAAYQGGLLLTQGEERRTQFDQLQRRLSLCQEFGIKTLLIVPDVVERLDGEDIDRVQTALSQSAELASAFDVRLALEFRSSTRWCASLPTAAALVGSINSPHLGLCLDLFHYYTGPSKYEDLGYLTNKNLFAVQLCDLSGVARELASDADRILPGEGDFLLEPIISHLKQIGYEGYVTVELMNPEIWKMKPTQVSEAAYTCVRMLLGQAGMPATLQEIGRP
jgi:2-keto-myo-inositol isomerase